MKNSRRGFLRAGGLLIAGVLSGSWKMILGNQDKENKIKEELKKLYDLSVEEQVIILRELENQFGTDDVKSLLRQMLKERISANWKAMAENAGNNDLETFINILWNKYCREGGLVWTETNGNNKTRMHCTYCPHAEKFKKLNATDWGYELTCMTDYYMMEGFNPNIRFERTKTLMQGDEYCNHTYITGKNLEFLK